MRCQWTRLDQFLILGNEGGTYYVRAPKLVVQNATAVLECLQADGVRTVAAIVKVSTSGRAPKNNPALFALALAASPKFADAKTNATALEALPQVARTGTHLCNFAAFVENLRGWGRGLRSAVANWYLNKPASELAYQMLKHQHRNRSAHRDLLRLSHPKASTPTHNALFQWAVEGEPGHLATPAILNGELRQIRAFELAKQASSEDEIVHLIEDYRLTHEMVPSEWKNSARVWESLLGSMPYMALLRNIGTLTAVGLLQPHSPATALVVARLMDRKRIANSGVHPIALLAALQAYKRGKWAPVANVIDALDEAFYLAFQNVEASGKCIYLALDGSCSMQGSLASAALAMVFARTEPSCTIAAFHVDIARNARLDAVAEAIARGPRLTDASLPIRDVLERGLAVDAFVIVTGNETWVGEGHPAEAIEHYRRATGIAAKLVVIAMAAERCSIADPNDALQLDVAGFDASVPGVVTNFIRG